MRHEPLGVGVMPKHFAIEALARFPLRWIASHGTREPSARGADDGPVAVPDQNVESQIGGVHFGHLQVYAFAQAVDLLGIKGGNPDHLDLLHPS